MIDLQLRNDLYSEIEEQERAGLSIGYYLSTSNDKNNMAIEREPASNIFEIARSIAVRASRHRPTRRGSTII